MPKYVTIDVIEITAETDAAFLCEIEQLDGRAEWLPKGQVFEPERYKKGDKDCGMDITAWIAEKKGIDT